MRGPCLRGALLRVSGGDCASGAPTLVIVVLAFSHHRMFSLVRDMYNVCKSFDMPLYEW